MRFPSAVVVVVAALLYAAASVAAPQVLVMSIANGRADLLVDGKAVRTLREGQSSPEGVTLVSATREGAVVEIEGERYTLALGQSTVAAVTLRADARGHYTTIAYLNGLAVPAIIDTGATTVALSADVARRLGIDYARGASGMSQTAGGMRRSWRLVLSSVRVGDIELANVEGAVVDASAAELPIVLVGMSYLNALEMQRSGDTLTLTKRR